MGCPAHYHTQRQKLLTQKQSTQEGIAVRTQETPSSVLCAEGPVVCAGESLLEFPVAGSVSLQKGPEEAGTL